MSSRPAKTEASWPTAAGCWSPQAVDVHEKLTLAQGYVSGDADSQEFAGGAGGGRGGQHCDHLDDCCELVVPAYTACGIQNYYIRQASEEIVRIAAWT